MSSGNIRNTRDTFLHFLADNLPTDSVHPVRRVKDKPQFNALQVSRLNVTFHDATYSTRSPTTQFLTLDILHDDELSALDLEESAVQLLQIGGQAALMDYSSGTATPVGNSLIYWDALSIKFRTVASDDYFHRTAVLELFVRYVNDKPSSGWGTTPYGLLWGNSN